MDRYSIEVALPDRPFCVREDRRQWTASNECQPATSAEAAWYIDLFAEEFGLYPPLLVRKTKLKRIVLCGEISFSRQRRPGFGGVLRQSRFGDQPLSNEEEPQRRGAIPDVEHHVCYFDVVCGRPDEEHLRKTIHHEFYHFVQRQQFVLYGDRGWAALNSPDFAYGTGGLEVRYDPNFWVMQTEEWGSGFLNRYSMSAPEEDQAEIFAHLIIEPARLEERVRTDDILRSKVERLKATLESFCPAVDAAFWRRVEESRWPYGL
jgi:hypothetical protein